MGSAGQVGRPARQGAAPCLSTSHSLCGPGCGAVPCTYSASPPTTAGDLVMNHSRRAFLAEVGQGALIASVGTALAADLGLAPARAADAPEALTFGPMESLVCLMQETAADKLLPILVKKLHDGADLKQLVAAAALANARSFGGEDYVGFHTMMALAPAYHMAREMPADQQALPVFKVLYRNATRIQEHGGRKKEVLRPTTPVEQERPGEKLREAVRAKDLARAEGV